MTTIYLVRHGETAWNRDEVFRGRADVPLSSRGREEAGLLAESLGRQPIVAAYTSPLARALDTARPAADRLGVPVTVDPRLADMSFGEWEGKALADVRARWPELHQIWTADPTRFRAPDGESLADVLGRAWPALEELADRHRGQAILLVSHRVVCKLLVCAALGVGEEGFWRVRLDTASVSLLAHGQAGWQVTRLNDTSHLRPLGEGGHLDF
jgi:broad specificity phosphatase PhoE